MKMYDLLHLFAGEYRILLREEEIFPFLRLLAKRKLRFWGLRKAEEGWLLCTSLSCAELLLRLAKEQGIEAEIERKRGLPFLMTRYRKRPGLLLGLLLGLGLLFVSELFVWKVSVNGNTLLSDKEVTEALERYGIGVGSYIPDIPVLRAQNEIPIRYRELSSVAINVKGTHIEVELLERTHAPEIEDNTGYCDVVASEDGIIVSVEAADGTVRVRPGDVVRKGQILIGSFMAYENNQFRMSHARGKVVARTYGSFAVSVPLEKTVRHYTGKTERKTSFCVLGKELDLFLSEESPFERFRAEVTEEPFLLFGFAETPVVKTSVLYREYTEKTVLLTEEQAKAEAEAAFGAWLGRQTDPVADYDAEGKYDQIQNAYILNVSVVYEKEIGTDSPVETRIIPDEQKNGSPPRPDAF